LKNRKKVKNKGESFKCVGPRFSSEKELKVKIRGKVLLKVQIEK